MIPRTPDGRVLFAVPWHEKILLGTTDTLVERTEMEPIPTEDEIDFILETARGYLAKAPTREDIRSVFAGLRPLAAPKEDGIKTKEIRSEEHTSELQSRGQLVCRLLLEKKQRN